MAPRNSSSGPIPPAPCSSSSSHSNQRPRSFSPNPTYTTSSTSFKETPSFKKPSLSSLPTPSSKPTSTFKLNKDAPPFTPSSLPRFTSRSNVHPLHLQFQQFQISNTPPSFSSSSSSSSSALNLHRSNREADPYARSRTHSPTRSVSRSEFNLQTISPPWSSPEDPDALGFGPHPVKSIVSVDYRSIAHMDFQQFRHYVAQSSSSSSLSSRPSLTPRESKHLTSSVRPTPVQERRSRSRPRPWVRDGVHPADSAPPSNLSFSNYGFPPSWVQNYAPPDGMRSTPTLYQPPSFKTNKKNKNPHPTPATTSHSKPTSKSKVPPPIFPSYLSKKKLQAGLKSGRFVYGILRVRKTFSMEAYVTPIEPALPFIQTIAEAETFYLTKQRKAEDKPVSSINQKKDTQDIPISLTKEEELEVLQDVINAITLDTKKTSSPMDGHVELKNITVPSPLDVKEQQVEEEKEEEKDLDVIVFGHLNRNRALDGDFVVLEFMDTEEALQEKEAYFTQLRKKNPTNTPSFSLKNTSTTTTSTTTITSTLLDTTTCIEKVEEEEVEATLLLVPLPIQDVTVEQSGVVLEEDEKEEEQQEALATTSLPLTTPLVSLVEAPTQRTYGRVIGIWKPCGYTSIPGLVLPLPSHFTGSPTANKNFNSRRSKENDPSSSFSSLPKWYTFKPLNRKLPLCAIECDTLPSFFTSKQDPFSYLYTVEWKEWKEHHRRPFVVLESCLGPLGDPTSEMEAILLHHGIARPEFSDSFLSMFPSGWSIPLKERETRVDRTSQCIFSIDPETAKDLDDALHIEQLNDHLMEVGVHIADVSYFVKPFTELDQHASKFCNSVYLLNEVIPMLPKRLCEELCSLTPGQERLCFSVIWKIDPNGTILDTRFERSIIRSRVKLTYEQVQAWLDGDTTNTFELRLPNDDFENIQKSIFALYELSKVLRQQRLDAGLLTLGNKKLIFEKDSESGQLSCHRRVILPSHRLNEEFMILANRCVAEKLYSVYPNLALVRNHRSPTANALRQCLTQWTKLGLPIHGMTSKELQLSLSQIEQPWVRQLVEFGSSRYMQKAKYICTYQLPLIELRHFALALSTYTHFTSPIRRYSDILVHRLLEAALNETEPSQLPYTSHQVQLIAHQCNLQKDRARAIEEEQQLVYVCFYLKQQLEPIPSPLDVHLKNNNNHDGLTLLRSKTLEKTAYLWKVQERYMELVILDLCLEVKLYYQDLPLLRYQIDLELGQVHLVWPSFLTSESTRTMDSKKEIFNKIDDSFFLEDTGITNEFKVEEKDGPLVEKKYALLDELPVLLSVQWDTSPPQIKVQLVPTLQ